MTPSEIRNLENASRSALAWSPEGNDAEAQLQDLFKAILPGLAILALAASILFLVAV